MKKGMTMGCIPRDTIEEAFKFAKESGYDGVEVYIAEDAEINFNTTKEEALKIKELANNIGIEICSLFCGLGWDYPITSNVPEIREKGKQMIHKQIEVASWLGCDTILVVPGIANKEISYDVAYNRAYETIKELSGFAEEKKVYIGIENVSNRFLLSPLELKDFIEKINSPYVGVYFDIGNVLPTGYPEQWISILGDKIKRMHIKDFNNKYNCGVELMTGDVDFKAVMNACREIGYDGWITAEPGWYSQYYDAMLESISRKMSIIFNS